MEGDLKRGKPAVRIALFVFRHPEPALVGEIPNRLTFGGNLTARCIEFVNPTGRGEIRENFTAVGQMHERLAVLMGEVTVTEFTEARVLSSGLPTLRFHRPEFAFLRIVAIVGREQEASAGANHRCEAPQPAAAVAAPGNLHQAVEKKERAGERSTGRAVFPPAR